MNNTAESTKDKTEEREKTFHRKSRKTISLLSSKKSFHRLLFIKIGLVDTQKKPNGRVRKRKKSFKKVFSRRGAEKNLFFYQKNKENSKKRKSNNNQLRKGITQKEREKKNTQTQNIFHPGKHKEEKRTFGKTNEKWKRKTKLNPKNRRF